MPSSTVFVIGATGAQGGGVARALLSNKHAVHALVRDPTSTASQVLKSQGASIFEGDWDNIPALEGAAAGCTGLFLNVYPQQEVGAELRHARNILSVSKRAGIKQVVYTSVIAADRYQSFHNPDPESFFGHYFLSKHTIEKEVQNGDFETWTILRGAAFMTNYLLPSSAFMFPQLPLEGRFVSASTPESKLYLIDPEDIGQFGFAAFANPGKFGGKGIDIAAELLGVRQIAEVMERVSGKTVEVSFLTEEEREAQKENPLIMGQVVSGKLPPWFHLEEAKAWGVKLHSFEEFLEREKDRLQKSIGKLA
jgi:uncharacterized protein YbjT (DUF2867 family)